MAKIDSFMGFSNVNPIVSFASNFNERFFDSDNVFLESKETYTHEDIREDGSPLVFSYKYCIEAEYCEGKIFYSLYLVPSPESLHKEKLEDVANCACVQIDEVDYYDICSYGLSILMAHDYVESEDVDNDILDFIASCVCCVNSLRGFYLDKYQNRIGTTGWDLIYGFLDNIDPYQLVLDRYRSER